MSDFKLDNIYLRSSSVQMNDGFDPIGRGTFGRWKIESQDIINQHASVDDADGNPIETKGFLLVVTKFVYFGFRQTGSIEQDKGLNINDHVFKITADIAASYLLESSVDLNDDIYKKINKNSVIHVWPYWRELLQSTMLRMSLRPSIVPLYPKGFADNLMQR